MGDVLLDSLFDTLKLLPYLFITFVLLEAIEHKLDKKNEKWLSDNKKYGVFIGSILGGLPQCGFSTVASSLFSSKVITMGTLIAVILSTSDEMLPIMISNKVGIDIILKIIGFKIIIGIIVGLLVDLFYNKRVKKVNNEIHDLCEHDHCDCEEDGILLSSLKHTIKIGLFVLVANILISVIIFELGEDKLSNLLLNKNIITYFISGLIGLIPNCASSVIITELYVSNMITIGTLLTGLLAVNGLGLLILFKNNKDIKENIIILSVIYFVSVIVGIIVDLVI